MTDLHDTGMDALLLILENPERYWEERCHRAENRYASIWAEGHEWGYGSGRYYEDDDDPDTLESRSGQVNPYHAVVPEGSADPEADAQHTPTLAEIRRFYVEEMAWQEGPSEGAAAFARFLVAHDRGVAKRALEDAADEMHVHPVVDGYPVVVSWLRARADSISTDKAGEPDPDEWGYGNNGQTVRPPATHLLTTSPTKEFPMIPSSDSSMIEVFHSASREWRRANGVLDNSGGISSQGSLAAGVEAVASAARAEAIADEREGKYWEWHHSATAAENDALRAKLAAVEAALFNQRSGDCSKGQALKEIRKAIGGDKKS